MSRSGQDSSVGEREGCSMKDIAIFGAKGYLGSQLAFYFKQKSCVVDEFDIPECDVTKGEFWHAFEAEKYDAILFFAGLTGTEKGFTDAPTYLAVNELGLLNLLMKLVPLGPKAPRIVFPSTRLVYRGSDEPLKEDATKETKTVYAVNKLACEGYLAAYHNRFGIPYNVLRICVPYGNLISTEYSYGTIGFFLKQISAGKPISLFGGGIVRRTFTHVEDICRAVEALSAGVLNGVYNVGGTDLSLYECATLVATRHQGSVESAEWPDSARLIESGSTVFDAGKLAADFGIVPAHAIHRDLVAR